MSPSRIKNRIGKLNIWKLRINGQRCLASCFLLLASVRSIDEEVKLKPATEIPKGKLNALSVMQRQEFNQDDIQDFKNPQVAGEKNDGLQKYFETERTKTDAGFKEFSSAIIAEKNENRIVTKISPIEIFPKSKNLLLA